METLDVDEFCQGCATCYRTLISKLDKECEKWCSRLRSWISPEDYKDDCSLCRFASKLENKPHSPCYAWSHRGIFLYAQTLPKDHFVRPPSKTTIYLYFQWPCLACLWYFFEVDKDHRKETIGFAHQVNPELDETDWDVIRQWIDGCLQRHQSGCIYRDRFNVPGFEVIDCNTRKLVPWDKKADFAALSYVWGSTQTQADLSNKLPQTQVNRTVLPNPFPERVIEDALICTSKLNIRYLWVDRYCIDQEDANNTKQRLIQSMDKIHSAAKVTIINATGNKALTGLPGVSETLRLSSNKVVIGAHTIIPVVNPSNEMSLSNWAKRGWTLQEGLLARRRLVFTDTRVYFQCTQSHYVEGLSGEFHSNEQLQSNVESAEPRVATQAFPRSVVGSGMSSFSMASVCDDFSSRDLKTDEDALNACSGIFSRFWTGTKPEYQYCGLPFQAKSDAAFALSLLWSAYGESYPDAIICRRAWGPSWSWLAWRGISRFNCSQLQYLGKQFNALIDIKLPRRHEKQDVMSTISDYIGEIDSGGLFQHWLPYLRLSGWIATLRFDPVTDYGTGHYDGRLYCYIAKGQGILGRGGILPHIWAKVLNEDKAFNSSRLLDVMFIADDHTDFHCLIIHRIGGETADTFERLGTCEVRYHSPEIKQVENMSYLTASEGEVGWRSRGKPGELRNLKCKFHTITLL